MKSWVFSIEIYLLLKCEQYECISRTHVLIQMVKFILIHLLFAAILYFEKGVFISLIYRLTG